MLNELVMQFIEVKGSFFQLAQLVAYLSHSQSLLLELCWLFAANSSGKLKTPEKAAFSKNMIEWEVFLGKRRQAILINLPVAKQFVCILETHIDGLFQFFLFIYTNVKERPNWWDRFLRFLEILLLLFFVFILEILMLKNYTIV
jgi:hypothetical protein